MVDFGAAIGRLVGGDITPGFNLSTSTAGSIPFISHSTPGPDYRAQAPASSVPEMPKGTGTNTAIAPTVDTAAAARAAAATEAANKAAGFSTSANGYVAGAKTGLRDVGNTYTDKTNQFLDTVRSGQDTINQGETQNALNLKQSMQNIVKNIQTGVRSGGVALAGKNASDSGAEEAMSRAWAQAGNSQAGEANGQAAQVDEDLMRQQGELNRNKDENNRSLDTYRDTETDRVRNDLTTKLATLSQQAGAAGVGSAVNTGVTDQVIAEAIQRLSGIDASRAQGLSTIHDQTPEEAQAEAARLMALGQGGNAFSVTGPQVSYAENAALPAGATTGLPIYTRGKQEQIAA